MERCGNRHKLRALRARPPTDPCLTSDVGALGNLGREHQADG
jgi:hypothetical protein